MLNFPNNASIYLCAQAVDLRKSFDGLSGLTSDGINGGEPKGFSRKVQ